MMEMYSTPKKSVSAKDVRNGIEETITILD